MYVVSLYQNPFEHSGEDTVRKMDIPMLETISRAIREAVLAIAMETRPQRQP